MATNIEYFKIKSNFEGVIGERFFKVNPMSPNIVEVNLNKNYSYSGLRGNIGIYEIKRGTYRANYADPTYIEKCTKRQFDSAFNKTVKLLNK